MLGVQDLFDPQDPWAHYITNALKAKELFVKDVNYIVRDGDAVIVDEFTGRVMPGRRWSDGQHQAIEAKEALQIQAETQTLASITYQNFFLLLFPWRHDRYGQNRRSGIREDLQTPNHNCSTNRVRARQDWADQVYKTETAKWRAVANETAEIHKKGRPVLVGTTSVEKASCSVLCWSSRRFPTTCSTPSRRTWSGNRDRGPGRPRWRRDHRHQHGGSGDRHHLGGNSDYMARLKLREVLLGRLVKPEDDHKPPVLLQRSAADGFADAVASAAPRSGESLYPAPSPTTPTKPLANWPVIW